MKGCVFLVGLALVVCAEAAGKDWVLLFTGADGFYSYPSHSCLCGAYHTLHAAGIPDERVVVIMYDDVARAFHNPYRGKLFNNYTRIDVYNGTPIDYSGEEITADLILSVLKGDKAKVKQLIGRVGKVIDSGPEDNVFVAAIGHGGPGYLVMPDKRVMTARQIIGTLQEMHDTKRFGKLIFYLESCDSGSIFQDLRYDINVYALTASTANEYAYMNYCDDPEFEDLYVCLGSQFTNGWVENTQHVDIRSSTFKNQSEAIIKAVNMSYPMLFGDQSLLNFPLQRFFGRTPGRQLQVSGGKLDSQQRPREHPQRSGSPDKSSVPFHSMYYTLLKRRLEKSPDDKSLQDKMARLQATMAQVDQFFYQTAKHAYPHATKEGIERMTSSPAERINNWDCYEAATEAVFTSCPGLVRCEKIQGYAFSKFSVLVNLCNKLNGLQLVHAVRQASRNNPQFCA